MIFSRIAALRPRYKPENGSRPAARRKRIFTVEVLEGRNLLAANQFAIIGDYGNGSTAEGRVADLVKSWEPAYIITTGDNNYPNGAASTIDAHIGKYYHDYIANYTGTFGPGSTTNRFFPSLGNHDYHATGTLPYLNYFTLPGNERYYDFVKGPVHFFAVNSEPGEPDGNRSTSKQGQWLQTGLANSTSEFNVVYFHKPPYSSGHHGNTSVMQWPFKTWGADIVLSGHDHAYERLIVDSFPYIVNGAGGAGLYAFEQLSDPPAGASKVRYNSDHGAMLVTVENTALTFEFWSLANGGSMIDRYIINAAPVATTVTKSFQNGISPTSGYGANIDTELKSSQPTKNYGSAVSLEADGSPDLSSLLKWDVTAVPAGSVVQSVSLTLNVTGPSKDTHEIYEIKKNWNEGQATWNNFATGSPWEIPGANGTTDRGSTVLGTLTATTAGKKTVTLSSSGISLVQSWVNSPSTNRGIMLHDYVAGTDRLNFDSSEAATAANRPKLTIVYAPVAPMSVQFALGPQASAVSFDTGPAFGLTSTDSDTANAGSSRMLLNRQFAAPVQLGSHLPSSLQARTSTQELPQGSTLGRQPVPARNLRLAREAVDLALISDQEVLI